MRNMGQLWWQKHTSTTIPAGREGRDGPIRTVGAAVATADHGHPWCNSLRTLMRKLKKQTKMLYYGPRPTKTFHCHYDPLSYARNFDRSGYDGAIFPGNDSDRFHTFSSRFVAAPSSAPPVAAISHWWSPPSTNSIWSYCSLIIVNNHLSFKVLG